MCEHPEEDEAYQVEEDHKEISQSNAFLPEDENMPIDGSKKNGSECDDGDSQRQIDNNSLSNSGFPGFGFGSDGEDESKFKSPDKNLLNMFEDNSFIDHP
mmetsp:Transcript_23867/g.27481  ORF Transcript_23867/g.27481 Transcript_23867/m.27481 type:complete len:100 (+) Transcript_23867:867-1166(+)